MRNKTRRQTFFRKARHALLGAALGLAVAGCGARSGLLNAQDGGPRPDVVQVDTIKPKPDAGVDSQKPDAAVPPQYSIKVKSLIGDYLDREVGDRGQWLQSYSLNTSEINPVANPFSNGKGGSIGPTTAKMYRISGKMFAPFATTTLKDIKTAKTYSEQQDLWVSGHTQYYDQIDDVASAVNMLAYTLKFSNPGSYFGVPLCTAPTGTDYSSCAGDNRTDRHKLGINLLGDNWVLTEMSAPATPVDNEMQVIGGGHIKLAKEAASGILNHISKEADVVKALNDPKDPNNSNILKVDGLAFWFKDLEPHGTTTNAIIYVMDIKTKQLEETEKVTPGTTKEFNINGKSYLFHVYNIAPGYPFGAKWADVAILSQELKLQHGFPVDPDNAKNKPWKAYLGWKNKGASAKDTKPDHLRTIIIHTDDIASLSSGGSKVLQTGDYIPLLLDPVVFKFVYAGLTNANASLLKFGRETSEYVISSKNGPDGKQCKLYPPYVKVKSGKSGATFTIAKSGDDQFLIATSGGACNNLTFPSGTVFIKQSPTSDKWVKVNYTSPEMVIGFPSAGDGYTSWENGGAIVYSRMADIYNKKGKIWKSGVFPSASGLTLKPESFIFAISERAGAGPSHGATAKTFFLFVTGGKNTPSSFNEDVKYGGGLLFKQDYTRYKFAGPVNTGFSSAEEGSVNERGSIYEGSSIGSAQFMVAGNIVWAQCWFSPANP